MVFLVCVFSGVEPRVLPSETWLSVLYGFFQLVGCLEFDCLRVHWLVIVENFLMTLGSVPRTVS